MSCSRCKKRRTKFRCVVHNIFICDPCVFAASRSKGKGKCGANCVIKSYSDWLDNVDIDVWPPHCSLCNRTISADPRSAFRLPCKCLFHTACLKERLADTIKDFPHHPHWKEQKLECWDCNRPMLEGKSLFHAPLLQLLTSLQQSKRATTAAASTDSSVSSIPSHDSVVVTFPHKTQKEHLGLSSQQAGSSFSSAASSPPATGAATALDIQPSLLGSTPSSLHADVAKPRRVMARRRPDSRAVGSSQNTVTDVLPVSDKLRRVRRSRHSRCGLFKFIKYGAGCGFVCLVFVFTYVYYSLLFGEGAAVTTK